MTCSTRSRIEKSCPAVVRCCDIDTGDIKWERGPGPVPPNCKDENGGFDLSTSASVSGVQIEATSNYVYVLLEWVTTVLAPKAGWTVRVYDRSTGEDVFTFGNEENAAVAVNGKLLVDELTGNCILLTGGGTGTAAEYANYNWWQIDIGAQTISKTTRTAVYVSGTGSNRVYRLPDVGYVKSGIMYEQATSQQWFAWNFATQGNANSLGPFVIYSDEYETFTEGSSFYAVNEIGFVARNRARGIFDPSVDPDGYDASLGTYTMVPLDPADGFEVINTADTEPLEEPDPDYYFFTGYEEIPAEETTCSTDRPTILLTSTSNSLYPSLTGSYSVHWDIGNLPGMYRDKPTELIALGAVGQGYFGILLAGNEKFADGSLATPAETYLSPNVVSIPSGGGTQLWPGQAVSSVFSDLVYQVGSGSDFSFRALSFSGKYRNASKSRIPGSCYVFGNSILTTQDSYLMRARIGNVTSGSNPNCTLSTLHQYPEPIGVTHEDITIDFNRYIGDDLFQPMSYTHRGRLHTSRGYGISELGYTLRGGQGYFVDQTTPFLEFTHLYRIGFGVIGQLANVPYRSIVIDGNTVTNWSAFANSAPVALGDAIALHLYDGKFYVFEPSHNADYAPTYVSIDSQIADYFDDGTASIALNTEALPVVVNDTYIFWPISVAGGDRAGHYYCRISRSTLSVTGFYQWKEATRFEDAMCVSDDTIFFSGSALPFLSSESYT